MKKNIFKTVLLVFALFLTSRFQLLKIDGISMEPTIKNKQYILGRKLGTKEKLEVGDVAVYVDSKGELVAHRIIYALPTGYIFKGDYNFGHDDFVPEEKVQYKIILY